MLRLSAYMDETGDSADEAQKFVGMAGLVAPAADWERFERKWLKALMDFKVPRIKENKYPYFHMKEFSHSRTTFEGWKGLPKREKLRKKLMTIIDTTNAVPFGTIIPMDVYRELPLVQRERSMDPYFLSFMFCGGLVVGSVRMLAPDETCAMVFSEHNKFRPKATKYYNMIREFTTDGKWMDEPLFRDMRKITPLQAADVVAYELYKEYDRRLYHPTQRPRASWDELLRISKRITGEIHFKFQDKNSLVDSGLRVSTVVEEFRQEVESTIPDPTPEQTRDLCERFHSRVGDLQQRGKTK